MLSGALEALEGRAGSGGGGGVVAPLMLVIVFLSNNL